MKTKHIIFLLGIFGAIAACRKTPDMPVNYPGSLYAGSYACVVTYECTRMRQTGYPYYTFDTIIGFDTITISGISSTCIVETGNFLASPYYDLNGDSLNRSFNDSSYYWSDVQGYSRESAFFFRSKDSMVISHSLGTGTFNTVFYIYNGHKIH